MADSAYIDPSTIPETGTGSEETKYRDWVWRLYYEGVITREDAEALVELYTKVHTVAAEKPSEQLRTSPYAEERNKYKADLGAYQKAIAAKNLDEKQLTLYETTLKQALGTDYEKKALIEDLAAGPREQQRLATKQRGREERYQEELAAFREREKYQKEARKSEAYGHQFGVEAELARRAEINRQAEIQQGYKNAEVLAKQQAAVREANRPVKETYQLPPVPGGEEAALSEALAKQTPGVQRFWAGREREILDPITAARKVWWEALNTFKQQAFEAQQRESSAAQNLRSRVVSNIAPLASDAGPEELVSYNKAVEQTIGGLQETDPQYLAAQENINEVNRDATRFTPPPDPLQEYLQKYPFSEAFMKLSPRQRGENRGIYAPPAVWGRR